MKIDEELKSLIPPLTEDERLQLKANLIADGCRDPLVVWGDILIDGHNRYEICMANNIPFKTVGMDFDSREDAMDWMDANQLGRRNLTPAMTSILLGRIYNRSKKAQHRPEKRDQNEPVNPERTSEALAKQHGVSPATVKRAGKFAEAVDSLGISKEVMSGEVKAPQREIVEVAKEVSKAPEPQREEVRHKAVEEISKPHVSKNSGNNEWYTPPVFIEKARAVMGSIDFDPASCAVANETIKATKYCTAEDSGLEKDWQGNVWMNPPYAQPLMGQFAERMKDQVESGNVKQGIVLVNNATETKWFADLAGVASCVCFPKSRVKFLNPDGNPFGAPLQGQAVFYIGENGNEFCENFSDIGIVMQVVK